MQTPQKYYFGFAVIFLIFSNFSSAQPTPPNVDQVTVLSRVDFNDSADYPLPLAKHFAYYKDSADSIPDEWERKGIVQEEYDGNFVSADLKSLDTNTVDSVHAYRDYLKSGRRYLKLKKVILAVVSVPIFLLASLKIYKFLRPETPRLHYRVEYNCVTEELSPLTDFVGHFTDEEDTIYDCRETTVKDALLK